MSVERAELWGSDDAYERYMGRWSRKVAPMFLRWLGAPPQKIWVDLGCGTGILTAQIARDCAPLQLIGIDTSQDYIAAAKRHLPSADFRLGSAVALDLADASTDLAVSGLVLNFLPDKAKGIAEMARITRAGGIVALYVWDYSGHMQIMRAFFDTAREFDPDAAKYDDGINAPICRPRALSEAFAAAGLIDVETTGVDIPTAFADFDDYWAPFLGGTGSAPKYCASLGESMRNKIRDAIRTKLPTGPDGEILLAARAWAVRGRAPD